jgi:hypothetical protein
MAQSPETVLHKSLALKRVALVGASATDGFGAEVRITEQDGHKQYVSVDLADVLDAAIVSDHRQVVGYGSAFFFTSPMRIGPRLLEQALLTDPTLLVAVDFLFWFAYGVNGPDGEPLASDDARMALLEEGLKLLDAVPCPLVLGDLSDMSPAIGIMLSTAQVPSTETLAVLNDRIRAWADQHTDVVVLPVSDLIGRIQQDEAIQIGPHHWPAGNASDLVQYDHLHPTAQGLIATVQLVSDSIINAGWANADDFDLNSQDLLERLQQRSRMKQ